MIGSATVSDRRTPSPGAPGTAVLPKLALAGCLCMITTQVASGVLISTKGGEEVRGFLIRQDDATVVIDEVRADGTTMRRTIARTEIALLVVTVAAAELAGLRHERPTDYRDLAEELAVKRKDPEAHRTALRLYLTAAFLDPERLGRSSLLGMVSLARNPHEERRFRAMLFLIDPESDRAVLREPDRFRPADSNAAEVHNRLLAAVRALRHGRKSEALRIAQRADVKQHLKRYRDILEHHELITACTPGIQRRKLTPLMLQKLIKLELAIISPVTSKLESDEEKERRASWSSLFRRMAPEPLRPLRLESLTEFDPSKSRFRSGAWIRPPSAVPTP